MHKKFLILLIILMTTAFVFAQDTSTTGDQTGTETGQDQGGTLGGGETTTPDTGTEGTMGAGEAEPATPEATPPAAGDTAATPEATPPATGDTATTGETGTLGAGDMPQEVSFSDVQGYSIQNTDGSIKGQVADAIVSPDGMINWILVEVTEPAGTAGTQYLVPPAVAVMNDAQSVGTFDVTSEELASLPTFDAGALGAGTADWETAAVEFWQNRLGSGATVTESTENPILLSDLMNYEVVGQNDESVGSVSDILVDMTSGTISSFRISSDAALGAGEAETTTPEATPPATGDTAATPEAMPPATGDTATTPDLGAGEAEPATPEATEPATPEATEPATPEAGTTGDTGTMGAGDTETMGAGAGELTVSMDQVEIDFENQQIVLLVDAATLGAGDTATTPETGTTGDTGTLGAGETEPTTPDATTPAPTTPEATPPDTGTTVPDTGTTGDTGAATPDLGAGEAEPTTPDTGTVTPETGTTGDMGTTSPDTTTVPPAEGTAP